MKTNVRSTFAPSNYVNNALDYCILSTGIHVYAIQVYASSVHWISEQEIDY